MEYFKLNRITTIFLDIALARYSDVYYIFTGQETLVTKNLFLGPVGEKSAALPVPEFLHKK